MNCALVGWAERGVPENVLERGLLLVDLVVDETPVK